VLQVLVSDPDGVRRDPQVGQPSWLAEPV